MLDVHSEVARTETLSPAGEVELHQDLNGAQASAVSNLDDVRAQHAAEYSRRFLGRADTDPTQVLERSAQAQGAEISSVTNLARGLNDQAELNAAQVKSMAAQQGITTGQAADIAALVRTYSRAGETTTSTSYVPGGPEQNEAIAQSPEQAEPIAIAEEQTEANAQGIEEEIKQEEPIEQKIAEDQKLQSALEEGVEQGLAEPQANLEVNADLETHMQSLAETIDAEQLDAMVDSDIKIGGERAHEHDLADPISVLAAQAQRDSLSQAQQDGLTAAQDNSVEVADRLDLGSGTQQESRLETSAAKTVDAKQETSSAVAEKLENEIAESREKEEELLQQAVAKNPVRLDARLDEELAPETSAPFKLAGRREPGSQERQGNGRYSFFSYSNLAA